MNEEARKGKANIATAHLAAALTAGILAKSAVSASNPKAAIDLIEVMHARTADAHRALDEIREAIDEDAAIRDVIDDTVSRAESEA